MSGVGSRRPAPEHPSLSFCLGVLATLLAVDIGFLIALFLL